jgi:hypothetical protein
LKSVNQYKRLWSTIRWFFTGTWNCFFLSKRDKKAIIAYEQWGDKPDNWQEWIPSGKTNPKTGKPTGHTAAHSKRIAKMAYDLAKESPSKKWKRHWRYWKEGFKTSCIIFWQATFVRPFCKHEQKHLSRPQWDWQNKVAYRGCTKCQKVIIAPDLKFEDTNMGVCEISVDGIKPVYKDEL